MGEIIVSIVIGALLVATGITMNVVLSREEKRWKAEQGGETPQSGGKT